MSFLFEYIGEMGKDYIYAVVPLLEDALMERDLVHRQIASAAIGHMALGVQGFGCEDALNHLLNCVWPNVFETSPHVIQVSRNEVDKYLKPRVYSVNTALLYNVYNEYRCSVC